VACARAAQPDWAATSPADRARVIQRFREVLLRRSEEVARIVTRESGKPLVDATGADVTVALDFAAWIATAAPRFLRASPRGVAGMTMWRKRVRTERQPLGVIGIIAPWNYPFFLPTSCVLPVLACGNAAIVKPSEFTPASGAILEDLFREAGLPDGLLQVIQGDGVTGAALTRGGVDKMMFTGGAVAGRAVAVACAEQLIPCSLELGGSDAAIVLSDADLQHAADGIAWTRFSNAGQTCVAPKRIYVEAPAYDRFVEAMARAVRALKVGNGADAASEVGPLIRPSAVATIRAQCDDAIAKGARIAAQASAPATGDFFPPTMLVDVDDRMRVLTEETFGPLLPVVKVRDEDEAIARANASSFGLSGSVWTADRVRGRAVARRLETGTVLINDAIAVVGMADVPYGGVKSSGLGRMHGLHGLEECVRSMPIVDDLFPRWHQAWWFGYGAEHLDRVRAYQRLAHGSTLGTRLSGLLGTIRLVLAKKGNG
jgi:acyl-CoA reductase-like NAD-dependent aldehyde dehydrogenase